MVNQTMMQRRKRRSKLRAFTLVEVTIAGCLLAVFISSAMVALTQINRWASASRLRTLALVLAQQRIDTIMTIPWQVTGTRPAILTVGTTTENNLPLNNDTFNSATGLSSAFTALDTGTNLTRTTVISTLGTRTLRAAVTVTFTYRNRPNSVTLTTLRATDSI